MALGGPTRGGCLVPTRLLSSRPDVVFKRAITRKVFKLWRLLTRLGDPSERPPLRAKMEHAHEELQATTRSRSRTMIGRPAAHLFFACAGGFWRRPGASKAEASTAVEQLDDAVQRLDVLLPVPAAYPPLLRALRGHVPRGAAELSHPASRADVRPGANLGCVRGVALWSREGPDIVNTPNISSLLLFLVDAALGPRQGRMRQVSNRRQGRVRQRCSAPHAHPPTPSGHPRSLSGDPPRLRPRLQQKRAHTVRSEDCASLLPSALGFPSERALLARSPVQQRRYTSRAQNNAPEQSRCCHLPSLRVCMCRSIGLL